MQMLQKAAKCFVINKLTTRIFLKLSNFLQTNDREPQSEKELGAKGKQWQGIDLP